MNRIIAPVSWRFSFEWRRPWHHTHCFHTITLCNCRVCSCDPTCTHADRSTTNTNKPWSNTTTATTATQCAAIPSSVLIVVTLPLWHISQCNNRSHALTDSMRMLTIYRPSGRVETWSGVCTRRLTYIRGSFLVSKMTLFYRGGATHNTPQERNKHEHASYHMTTVAT